MRVIEAAGGQLAWEPVAAGAGAVARYGDPLPAATIDSIKRTRLALKAANPTGLMLSAAMLLDHVEQREAAARLRAGVMAALASAETRTGDLGGRANTAQYTEAVIRAMR
jgi:isocitrate/isopropylmalate dehydrogenase